MTPDDSRHRQQIEAQGQMAGEKAGRLKKNIELKVSLPRGVVVFFISFIEDFNFDSKLLSNIDSQLTVPESGDRWIKIS